MTGNDTSAPAHSATVDNLPFTDSHVHFFDREHPVLRFDWLEAPSADPVLGDVAAIASRRYDPAAFFAEARFQHVGRVIHVEAAVGAKDPVVETQWVMELAERTGAPHGIVAGVDLAARDVAERIGRQREAARLVRGVRDIRDDDAYLGDPAWRRGAAELGRHDLVLCIEVPVARLTAVAELARSIPDVTICVDHCGAPPARGSDELRAWRRALRDVAAADNTVIKISGLGMGDRRWTIESLRPWILGAIDLFGPHRAFFGTNWPVDRLYSSYSDVVAAYRATIGDLSVHEQRALLSGTADRVFRLV